MKTKRKTGKKSSPRRTSSPGAAQPPGTSHTGTVILATLAISAAGVLGYFGYQAYKKHKDAKSSSGSGGGEGSDLDKELLKLTPRHTTTSDTTYHSTETDPVPQVEKKTGGGKSKSSSSSSGDFPLKKGSKGDNVRKLQQALMDKYGSSILPKYGADGDFGSETQNALKKNGLPTIVSESTFNVIVQGGGSSGSSDISGLAKKLYDAATAKNFNGVLNLLKQMNTKDDYQQVSTGFRNYRLHGVRQTLVNGLLNSFTSEDQKQKIRLEFIRMGLQYDGSKWALSGFDGRAIVTVEPATVWVNTTQSVQVPAMMVLGHEVTQRLDYTLFENNNNYYLVKTQSIKYL